MSFEVLEGLQALLKEGFSQTPFRMPDREPGEYTPPNFFLGSIPASRKGNDPDFEKRVWPYIVNRFWDGEDREGGSFVTVRTLCGIYTAGDNAAGEQDIYNMVARGRRIILENQVIDRKYTLVHPLKWGFGDAGDHHLQIFHPYYGGYLVSTWQMPVIERQLSSEEEVRIYGAGYK